MYQLTEILKNTFSFIFQSYLNETKIIKYRVVFEVDQ